MDKNGYPTDDELEIIKNWDIIENGTEKFHKLMQYVESLWRYADEGYWHREGDKYRIATAGWSGNESIVGALMENTMFWMMYWKLSRRGGLYIFQKLSLVNIDDQETV